MGRLADHPWKPLYTPDGGNLVKAFYVPALECAKRYDRAAGYFAASALALAVRGVEGLVVNKGRMRLLVGCTLDAEEVAAIEKGESLKATVEAHLMKMPLIPPDAAAKDALELLAWMVAREFLAVKVAVPCDAAKKPLPGLAIFHAKGGVIEDKTGDRLAFNGSVNETEAGWTNNYETFHVFTSWDGGEKHVAAEDREFQTLWANQSKRALVMDVPAAKREQLLQFLPKDDQPVRLVVKQLPPEPPPVPDPEIVDPPSDASPVLDPRKLVWSFIHAAPTLPGGGERVGEVTSAVTPWPHQVRAFKRMYDKWPPKLLIADEVGLGKTIQAGLLLRQAWLSGRAKRILVMAPKAVMRQWQIELREKFNLNWPLYDGGRFSWRECPALGKTPEKPVSRKDWHKAAVVIVSSHLMRRADRARELLEDAEPWDLIVLDEAHHARRRGGAGDEDRPNQLLRLMRQLKDRTQGLVLLTATPMQVSPIEVWDLLSLLGLPPEWTAPAFLRFFEACGKPSPSHEEMIGMAALFRAVEAVYGEVPVEEAKRVMGVESIVQSRRVLRRLREGISTAIRLMENDDRKAAIRLMRAHTPIRCLISRHTRKLLRKYFEAGKISTPIATRAVEDRFVALSPAETAVYKAVQEYISNTYNATVKETKTAVGFVMTIYRRRLASSFYALAQTLEGRLEAVGKGYPQLEFQGGRLEDDVSDDEAEDEVMDADDAAALEQEALALEEKGSIHGLLKSVRRLGTDTKAKELVSVIHELRNAGYPQVIVFTQYTDTMDFLRGHLVEATALDILCYSGRGGEIRNKDGTWTTISREDTKKRFREKAAQVLICTDAAAEGLNFQFCGALINYDMPWNPMRVEQRIGRIDRLGQSFPTIRIVNLHYKDTVETDVYVALRERIKLFETFVGGLQPILAKLPKAIQQAALAGGEDRDRAAAELKDSLVREVDEAEEAGFDLDETTDDVIEELPRPPAPYDLSDLGRILKSAALLPPGDDAKKAGKKDFTLLRPGRPALRVTVDPEFFEQHADSVEFWTPGSPLFPEPAGTVMEGVTVEQFRGVVGG